MNTEVEYKLGTIVLYTLNPWENALPVLRIVGPAQRAGFRVVPGNRMETVSPKLVSVADMVVVQRDFPRLTKAYAEILARARREGKPIIYDMDDLLLELPTSHPDQQSGYYDGAFFPMLQAMLDADVVTTSTPPLHEYLQQFNRNVHLLPNLLNEKIWSLRSPGEMDSSLDHITIGYMGGNSHALDLEFIAPVLGDLICVYGDRLRLKFWGVQPPVELRGHPNVTWIPLSLYDYTEFAAYFSSQQCDICIAPMIDSFFNRYKSAIKFLEYSALGIPGVYSRIAPYETIVEHGINGFLAASPEDWEEYLVHLIENPTLRNRMSVKAQQTVREGWLLSHHAQIWQDAYQSASHRAQKPVSDLVALARKWEQAMLSIRTILTPPGSYREQIVRIPVRTTQILKVEGMQGVIRRAMEKTNVFSGSSASSALLRKKGISSEKDLSGKKGRRAFLTMAVSPDILTRYPKVSIIILTYNNLNYTRLCLNSIFDKTHYSNFEIIVVDNASTDETPTFLKVFAASHQNVRLILNATNYGFARANNQAAQATVGDIIVFLNNDTVVTSNWLTQLIAYLRDARVGMVGPVTNSSGNESCIEVAYRNLKELDVFAKEYTQIRIGAAFEIRMLALFCVALRRSVFDEVGPLDEQFGTGMFEDDDYALRVKKKGFQIICAEDVFIHHWGSASFSHLKGNKFYRLFDENKRKFENKWGIKWIRPQFR